MNNSPSIFESISIFIKHNRVPLFLISVLALLSLSLLDDDLSEEAKKFIHPIESTQHSESYLFLTGMLAAPNEDPIEVGQHELKEHGKAGNDPDYSAATYPEDKILPLPEGEEFCELTEETCLAYLFNSDIEIEQLLTDHAVLLERANLFLQYDEFTTLSKPEAAEWIADYSYLTRAIRIQLLIAISEFKKGNIEAATQLLEVQLTNVRRAFALQDILIGRLILLNTINDIINVHSVILTNVNIEVKPILRLNSDEKSFDRVLGREFATYYNSLYKELKKYGDSILGRVIYKPNMTINAQAAYYEQYKVVAKLNSEEFAKMFDTYTFPTPNTSQLHNYLGSVFLSLNIDLVKQFGIIQNMDVKIALFNQMHIQKLPPEKMINPYYPEQAAEQINNYLCVNGPIDYDDKIQCILTKL